MSRWNDPSDFRTHRHASSAQSGPGREFFGCASEGSQSFHRWVERARAYLKSRTADHWLMFIAGLLIGALLG